MQQAGILGMMRAAAIGEELKLTDEQKGKITSILEEAGPAMSFQQGDTPEAMADKVKAAREKYEPKVKEVLTDEQKTRIQQIYYQATGPTAMADEAVAKEVGLDDEGRTKVAAVAKEMQDALGAIMREAFGGGGGGGGGGDFREKAQKIRTDAATKVLGVLSDDQKKTWETMLGEPFDLAKLRPQRQRPGGTDR
jgi:hypothetical protein